MSLKVFFFFSSGGLFVQQSGNDFSKLCKGAHKEHFCEIILKSNNWSKRRCRLKVVFFFIFLALAASLFSGVERF